MAGMRISDLTTASAVADSDLLEVAKVDGNSSSGYMSYKETMSAIAIYITKLATYSNDLNTTDKHIIGAINELKQLVSLIPQFAIEVVAQLPTQDISETTIYLVPNSDPEQGNYYEEYIYVNNAWELVGSTEVDLSDYYTKSQVDGMFNGLATVATSGSYTDLSNKPTIDSALSTSSTNAVQNQVITNKINGLMDVTETMDTTPYVYRQTPSGQYTVKEQLIGGSVVWNQLVANGNFASTSGWNKNGGSATTWSVADNVASITATSTNGGIYRNIDLTADHIYLYKCKISNTKAVSFGFSQFTRKSVSASETMRDVYFISKASSSSTSSHLDIYSSGSSENTIQVTNVMVFDLTKTLGTTIANYVYTLEQNTSGSGVAWFRKYFPEVYYAYSAPTIQSTKVSAKVVKDSEDTTVATYDLSGSHLVKRNYEYRAYASGDESLPDTITDGTNTVTKRTTPITETVTNPTLYGIWKLDANNNLYFDGDTCDDIPNPQIVENGGTEEFIDAEVQAGNRDVSMPVGGGHKYGNNPLIGKLLEYIQN